MVRVRGVHRTNQRDVIHASGDVRKKRADFGTALTIWFEFPLRLLQKDSFIAGPVLDLRVVGFDFHTMLLRQFGPWIERIDVRDTACHEQKDDVLGLGWKVRLARDQRITTIGQQMLHDARKEHGSRSSGADVVNSYLSSHSIDTKHETHRLFSSRFRDANSLGLLLHCPICWLP